MYPKRQRVLFILNPKGLFEYNRVMQYGCVPWDILWQTQLVWRKIACTVGDLHHWRLEIGCEDHVVFQTIQLNVHDVIVF